MQGPGPAFLGPFKLELRGLNSASTVTTRALPWAPGLWDASGLGGTASATGSGNLNSSLQTYYSLSKLPGWIVLVVDLNCQCHGA
jgi:hypothetical protein